MGSLQKNELTYECQETAENGTAQYFASVTIPQNEHTSSETFQGEWCETEPLAHQSAASAACQALETVAAPLMAQQKMKQMGKPPKKKKPRVGPFVGLGS